jgi:hypothetical protein
VNNVRDIFSNSGARNGDTAATRSAFFSTSTAGIVGNGASITVQSRSSWRTCLRSLARIERSTAVPATLVASISWCQTSKVSDRMALPDGARRGHKRRWSIVPVDDVDAYARAAEAEFGAQMAGKRFYEDMSDSGEGASFWWSGNDQVGEGRMTIVKTSAASSPNEQVFLLLYVNDSTSTQAPVYFEYHRVPKLR